METGKSDFRALCWYPRATLIKDHKQRGLNSRDLLSQVWEAEISAGLVASECCEQKVFSRLFRVACKWPCSRSHVYTVSRLHQVCARARMHVSRLVNLISSTKEDGETGVRSPSLPRCPRGGAF